MHGQYRVSNQHIHETIHEVGSDPLIAVALSCSSETLLLGDLPKETQDLLPRDSLRFIWMFPDMDVADAQRVLRGEFTLSTTGELILTDGSLRAADTSKEYAKTLGVAGSYKVEDIKRVRQTTKCGLKEAKEYVESLPWTSYSNYKPKPVFG